MVGRIPPAPDSFKVLMQRLVTPSPPGEPSFLQKHLEDQLLSAESPWSSGRSNGKTSEGRRQTAVLSSSRACTGESQSAHPFSGQGLDTLKLVHSDTKLQRK